MTQRLEHDHAEPTNRSESFGGPNSLMSLVQFRDLFEQFIGLARSKTNSTNVVDGLTVIVVAVVTQVRLDGERPEQ